MTVSMGRVIVRDETKIRVERINKTQRIISQNKQGRTGPPGATSTTVINIVTPALTWTLAHYLSRYPSVTLIDTSGDIMLATLTYVDSNVITVTFSAPTNGSAYLN